MRFGPVPIADAAGAILAHGEPLAGFKKGRVLLACDIDVLRAAGIAYVTVARLDPGDIGEDEAARRVAAVLSGDHVRASEASTGRVNLYAATAGIVRIDTRLIDAINQTDESVTVATLPSHDPVRTGAMIATVKIIPYAAPGWAVAKAEEIAASRGALRVYPFRRKSVALISTETPGFKRSLLEKNRQVTEDRVVALGSSLAQHIVCPHTVDGLANALKSANADLVLVFGATANSDRADVIPAAIETAGGQVDHVGMPVDPGNLLVLGDLNGAPVVGLPGCARSPKRNGFDYVLERLCADIAVTGRDIMGMGVGGLLKEIPVRGHPREGRPPVTRAEPQIAAIVLAAGRSTRMGGNKLLMEIAGVPLIHHTIATILATGVQRVVVVTGHEQEKISSGLPDFVTQIYNPAYASGMASSLRAGIAALSEDVDAALVALGDMPAIQVEDIEALLAAFDPAEGKGIVVPTHNGVRGHPVLFGRKYWSAILAASGDQGARQALIDNADAVCEVPIDHSGVLMDADTPEALAALRAMMDE